MQQKPSSNNSGIVIIGSGIAGCTLARELRQAQCSEPITLITADDGTVYAKPKLSNSLTQGKTPEQLADSSAATFAAELQLQIHTHCLVTAINTDAHSLEMLQLQPHSTPPDKLFQPPPAGSTPQTISWRALVLATGSSPVRLPLKGDGAADALSINSLTDYHLFRQRLQPLLNSGKGRVAIIGPGLVGCEFTNDLLSTGLQVDVIGPDPWPLSLLLPEAPARQLQQALQAQGAHWHLGSTTQLIERDGTGYALSLSNDEQMPADLVLSAAGVRPQIALGQAAGLQTRGGICTDAHLRTSAADVYSLGDCAEIEGVVRLFIIPIRQAAKCLAQTLSGTPTPVQFPPMPMGIKTSIHPINLLSPGAGASLQTARWQCEEDKQGVLARYRNDEGQLTGFVLSGERVRMRAQLMKELAL